MLDDYGPYDEAFSDAPGAPRPPLRVGKTISQRVAFYAANAIVLPLVAVCYLTVSAEGLRAQLPVMSTRLSRLPVPGAGYLAGFDGWDRLDLATVTALGLCAAVTMIWIRVFEALMSAGGLAERFARRPALTAALAAVVLVIVLGDLTIFFAGLSAKSHSGWSQTAWYVAPLASVLYVAGLALIGAWHADYRQSGAV